MQLIVLGMHRSGTSVVTRLLNLMGAYFGPEGVSLGANEENPKGFWERRDVLDLDEALLESAGASWYQVADFSREDIPEEQCERFRTQARSLLLEMDGHRPWVMKEPRLALLLPLWLELMEVPVGVFVHRSPIQVARSLQHRNGFPIDFSLALWERYTLDTLQSAGDLPMVRVLHAELMRDPMSAMARLLKQLQGLGVQGLRLPSEREIQAFIDPALYRQQADAALEAEYINLSQQALAEAIETDFEGALAEAPNWRQSAGGQSSLRAYLAHLEDEQQLAEQGERLQGTEQQLVEQGERLQGTEQQLAERDRQLVEQGERLQGTEQQLAERDQRLQASAQALNARTAELAAERQAAAQQRARLQAVQRQLAELSAELSAEREGAAQQEARLRETAAAVTAAQAERETLGQRLGEQIAHYRAVLGQLERNFEALGASARWRLGHWLIRPLEVLLLRGRPRLVTDEASETFAAVRVWEEAMQQRMASAHWDSSPEVMQLREWLGLLAADFDALMCSKRWVVGSTLVRLLEILIGRFQVRLVSEQMRALLTRARRWTPSGDEARDLGQLQVWLESLDRDLAALEGSKRWQVGNALVGTLDRLLLRGRSKLVVDHMREVLGLFASWRDARITPLALPPAAAAAHFETLATLPAPTPQDQRVDVVVPVFNARAEVQQCLESVLAQDDGSLAELIVVNDGSGAETSDWLRAFCQGRERVRLIEHAANLGYTRAVNTGLEASRAPFIVLLNSDTQVTPRWLEAMLRCMDQSERIGIVGPLSNAATWQNVPALLDESGHFANNPLPAGMTPEQMAWVVVHASARRYPRTPFVNGFCFMIRRAVIEAIGMMDAERFPVGYGEENDFCIRAAAAGFQLRIVDDAYVFHVQSKSFGHERRQALSEQGFKALEEKHGVEHFHALVEQVKETSAMDEVRARVQASLAAFEAWTARRAQLAPHPDAERYRPRRHGRPEPAAVATVVHVILYSDYPGPELRLSLEALEAAPAKDQRILHVAADWVPEEQRFAYEALVKGQVHHFVDGRGFYAAVRQVMDAIGPAPVCVLRQGVVLLPEALEAMIAACLAPDGFAAVSPITDHLAGLAVPLRPGEQVCSARAKIAEQHGPGLCVATPLLDMDVFMLGTPALATVPFPDFLEDATPQSLVRYCTALRARGLDLGIALTAYAPRVLQGAGESARPPEQLAGLAESEDRPALLQQLHAFEQAVAPLKTVLAYRDPPEAPDGTVCLLLSTLQLFGGVVVLVNWANHLILSGMDVRVYVLHLDDAPATGLRLLFKPRPFTRAETIARELPEGTRVVASLWSTVAPAEALVEQVPAATGYYFIQDYEPRFYSDSLADAGHRRAAEATYHSKSLIRVTTSRWIASQLPRPLDAAQDWPAPIPVGIDHAIYPPTVCAPYAAEGAGTAVILAMARPETPRRGFGLLVKALQHVKQRHPEVRIRLFGSDALAKQQIPFAFDDLGVQSGDALRHLYAAADLFIDTSDFQGFGLCPLEAMALGCACVLTDSGGIREYAREGVNALIVSHESTAISDAVSCLIEDPDQLHRLAIAAVETARDFDMSRTAREWLSLFADNPPPSLFAEQPAAYHVPADVRFLNERRAH